MLHGVAIGGPRDGVKLSAPVDWNGRVSYYDRQKFAHAAIQKHHPGRYKWSTAQNTWVWVPDVAI